MYKLSNKSKREMMGIDDRLQEIIELTIQITTIDFMVFDGLRTQEEQEEYVRRGVSWTMHSKHLTGHAMDLVPLVNNKTTWNHKPCFELAEAVMKAARQLDINLLWGGAWNNHNLKEWAGTMEQAHDQYKQLCDCTQGMTYKWDGPHFELTEGVGYATR